MRMRQCLVVLALLALVFAKMGTDVSFTALRQRVVTTHCSQTSDDVECGQAPEFGERVLYHSHSGYDFLFGQEDSFTTVADANPLGSVSVFRRTADSADDWVFHQRLTAPVGHSNNYVFGFGLSASGLWLAISDQRYDDGTNDSGAVFVFVYNTSLDLYELQASVYGNEEGLMDPANYYQFGKYISLADNKLVVTSGDRGVEFWLYEWPQGDTLDTSGMSLSIVDISTYSTPPAVSVTNWGGCSGIMDMAEGLLVMHASISDGTVDIDGETLSLLDVLLTFNLSDMAQDPEILYSDADNLNRNFGTRLSIDMESGNTGRLVTSVPDSYRGSLKETGSLMVYTRSVDNLSWELEATLEIEEPWEKDHLGEYVVALKGDFIAAQTQGDSSSVYSNRYDNQSVYVFALNSDGVWRQTIELTAGYPSTASDEQDYYGLSVCIGAEGEVLVGSPSAPGVDASWALIEEEDGDPLYEDVGMVYAYRVEPEATLYGFDNSPSYYACQSSTLSFHLETEGETLTADYSEYASLAWDGISDYALSFSGGTYTATGTVPASGMQRLTLDMGITSLINNLVPVYPLEMSVSTDIVDGVTTLTVLPFDHCTQTERSGLVFGVTLHSLTDDEVVFSDDAVSGDYVCALSDVPAGTYSLTVTCASDDDISLVTSVTVSSAGGASTVLVVVLCLAGLVVGLAVGCLVPRFVAVGKKEEEEEEEEDVTVEPATSVPPEADMV
ncbi:hypothetical protein KIPB_003457 [Kipferlia bialata]|uniref:Uncharacterized protein n=1 Tax=Kipferlia bialata TaxID=797122 RepID=A0A9K3CTX2_9EUKA|nr:hypothetical protein KIPB_003457 [Kipferlia bialata]|eukprot:g3457.t1